MATATVPVTDKATRAAQLREQVRAFSQELTKLRADLAKAAGSLALLENERDAFAQELADGKTVKSSAVAEIHAKIDEARLPLSVLQRRVSEKESAFGTVHANLDTLDQEIAIEAQQEARRARFQSLEKQGIEAAARIAEKIRALIEDDLPAFDAVRDCLVNEFVGGRFSTQGGPEANAARSLINEIKGKFFDGPFLAVERRLLRAGWQERGDIVFDIKNLRPPKR